MKHLILNLILVFWILNIHAQWTNIGLNGLQVNDLTIYSDTIYASTNNGLFKKNILNTDTTWLSCGNHSYYYVQTLVVNSQTFISLVQLGTTYRTQIYKSINFGKSFELMTTDTSNISTYQFLDHIAHPNDNYDTLYFLNHQLKTYDGGITWESIYNRAQSDRFIMVNPINHSQLIIGGETGFFSAYLQYSNDNGNTWTFPAMNSFFAGDNAIHDIVIDNTIWYAAGEGVIAKSIDEGESWEQLLNPWDDNSPFNLYYTDIEFSPLSKNILYVTGLNSTSSNIVPLLYSENQGLNWDSTFYISLSTNQKIRCLTTKNIDNIDNVFLGGIGVFLYKKNINNIVKLNVSFDLVIYPNPVKNLLYIKTDKKITKIRVYDILGYQIKVGLCKDNFIQLGEIPRGLYFISATIENKEIIRKFIKE
ncbi:MAG TPA: hypothetical protein DD653_15830 [Marinilabiliales bacterium]|nr:hypothetical protein [Marinilabiliales bacterium]